MLSGPTLFLLLIIGMIICASPFLALCYWIMKVVKRIGESEAHYSEIKKLLEQQTSQISFLQNELVELKRRNVE